ncbi:MAG TPA: aldolase/citrate lyase family protein [Thermoanaerobaculia bacterium]
MELYLFTTDVDYARETLAAGIDGLVVDWEHLGKQQRQSCADTEVNHDTLEDLVRLRRSIDAPILVRIHGTGDASEREVEEAIGGGATEILLPMVRRVEDVTRVLRLIDGRCPLGILIETTDAVRIAADLCSLPLSRVYVGLNDLSIDRGVANIFTSVADGTIENVRRACPRPFGFAGLTHPAGGAPIPCRLLISEMVRLECTFSFVRRSFRRDAQRYGVAEVVRALREEIEVTRQRSSAELLANRDALVSLVEVSV